MGKFTSTNSDGRTPQHMPAFHKWLITQDWCGMTPLHRAARYQSEAAFLALLERASASALNQALIIQDSENLTALHMAALHQSEAAFLALIGKADPVALNQALIIKHQDGWTALHMAARDQSEAAFLALIAKADPSALNQALIIKNQDGWTPLHYAARYQSEAAFLALIAKADPVALNQALIIKNQGGWTALHRAARNQSEEAFLALIAKADPSALNQALIIKNQEGWTALHRAARYQSEAAFLALIAKADPSALNQAFIIENQEGWTALHRAARNQSEAAFLALIAKASPSALNQALVMQNNEGWTPLHMAARHKTEAGFLALIEKADEAVISMLIRNDTLKNSPLCLRIANKIFDSQSKNGMRDVYFIASLLKNKKIASFLPTIASRFVRKRALTGNKKLQQLLLNALLEKLPSGLGADELALLKHIRAHLKYDNDDCKAIIYGNLSFMDSLRNWFLPASFEALISGFLEQSAPDDGNVPEAIDNAQPVSPELLEKIKSNRVLVKILVSERYSGYLEQLSDYTHRPALRDTVNNPQYKFVHMQGKVVAYQYKRKAKSNYTHTKKSSMTLIGTHLNTPVFGSHDTKRPLVGYLFDKDQCVIKAMLKEDSGTINKQWVADNFKDAENAARLVPDYNFTDAEKFNQEVNSAFRRTNEVLAKVNRQSILAIVVARKDEQSLRIAHERQQDAMDQLNRNLPIVFYDADLGCVELISEGLSPPNDQRVGLSA